MLPEKKDTAASSTLSIVEDAKLTILPKLQTQSVSVDPFNGNVIIRVKIIRGGPGNRYPTGEDVCICWGNKGEGAVLARTKYPAYLYLKHEVLGVLWKFSVAWVLPLYFIRDACSRPGIVN